MANDSFASAGPNLVSLPLARRLHIFPQLQGWARAQAALPGNLQWQRASMSYQESSSLRPLELPYLREESKQAER